MLDLVSNIYKKNIIWEKEEENLGPKKEKRKSEDLKRNDFILLYMRFQI